MAADKSTIDAELDSTMGIVLYTDGSSRPNPGNTGWGAHGYLFMHEEMDKGTGLTSQIITANGYEPALTKAKEAFTSVKPIKYFDFFGSNLDIGSNNSAEIEALTFALEGVEKYRVAKITALTDSEYVRRGLEEGVRIWKKKNWVKNDGNPVPNTRQWLRLIDIVDKLKLAGTELNIRWVKGHSDVHGNIIADELATLGHIFSTKRIFRCEFKTSDAKGYWKTDVEYNPFLSYKHMYFNSVAEYNVPGTYYLARPGADENMIGKKTPDTCYSIIHLSTPDAILEEIRARQFDASDDINSVILLRLDKVYSPQVYKYLNEYGGMSLLQSSRGNLGLSFLDDKPLTVEQNPAGLALRAIENFGTLELILERFNKILNGIECPECKSTDFTIQDITKDFYTIETEGKELYKLKSNFVSGLKGIDIIADIMVEGVKKEIKVPIILGLDILTRNELKKIEASRPNIYLVHWKESKQLMRYAVVIRNVLGTGIWSNTFSNNVIIK